MAKIMNLILLISLLLAISMAEGALFGRKKISSIDCGAVYGVQAGDTCSEIEQGFSLTDEFFSAVNPNLNCDKLFAGQWVCVSGSVGS